METRSLILKYNLTEKRYEDNRTREEMMNEAVELWKTNNNYEIFLEDMAKVGLMHCLLNGEACAVEKQVLFSLSREAIETYLEEQG